MQNVRTTFVSVSLDSKETGSHVLIFLNVPEGCTTVQQMLIALTQSAHFPVSASLDSMVMDIPVPRRFHVALVVLIMPSA